MSIATYAELKTALADYLHRSNLTAKLPDFILTGEGRLNRELRMLDMIQTQTATLSTLVRTLALPTRYADKINFRINSPLYELIYRTPKQLEREMSEIATTGQPKFYTVTDTFEFDRLPDSAYSYTLKYYQGYKLAQDSDTNYLLTNYPQAYLYASMKAAAIWIRDWTVVNAMEGLLRDEIAAVKKAERVRKSAGQAQLTTELNTVSRYSIDQG